MTAEAIATVEVRTLVRVSFLLRMMTLLASLAGYVDQTLTPVAVGAIFFLTLTSMAGIAVPSVPAFLQRHPILVMLDGLVMTGLMIALGTDNPLVLVALSSCVIVGVVLPTPAAALSTMAMVSGYVAAGLFDDRLARTFLADYGFPVTFVCVVVLGQVFRTLAERKRQSERAFTDLVSSAVTAQERTRLARELHDSTAKTLQGLALSAQSLPHWIERDPRRAASEAVAISSSAGEAIIRLRSLLSALRQDDLDQPFHESLAALARDCTHDSPEIRLTLELAPVPLSAPSVRYELLAAAREALCNAVTHSGSDRITVRLFLTGEEEVAVEVTDQGRGFAPGILPERERQGHFGVRGYSERLQLIGGHADVDTAPGRGTRVRLVAPLMGLREGAHA
ncbi:sensor histidine kinase [Nocardioides sp. SYSU DS0663]|uniref:sensor histidine kinase n=1 Tax=Nocardioides sp. SYSU DS0663 TaxID=3416445 RepID=UPI003F4B1A8F